MKTVTIALLATILALPAAAQQPYAAPEQELWNEMKQALGNVPMALSAHQQVQQVLQQVEREAQMRAARKAKPEEKK